MISLMYFLIITLCLLNIGGATKNIFLDILLGIGLGAVLTTVIIGLIYLFTTYLP